LASDPIIIGRVTATHWGAVIRPSNPSQFSIVLIELKHHIIVLVLCQSPLRSAKDKSNSFFVLLPSHLLTDLRKPGYFLEPIYRLIKRNNFMVRHRATFWNRFFDSLLQVDAKLTKLGFVYLDGKVVYLALKEHGK
jgi:hypothetical protein